jgi:hypothetical protein
MNGTVWIAQCLHFPQITTHKSMTLITNVSAKQQKKIKFHSLHIELDRLCTSSPHNHQTQSLPKLNVGPM